MALYCSLEVVNAFPKAEDGIPMICDRILNAAEGHIDFNKSPAEVEMRADVAHSKEKIIRDGRMIHVFCC